MRVVILLDSISLLDTAPDLVILDTIEAVEAALATHGHEAIRLPVSADGRWVTSLYRTEPDLVFNLCEGINGRAELEPAVISTLEWLEIPYTGSSSWTTAICLRKNATNALLSATGLPVPSWEMARPGASLPTVGFPAICKPAAEDASLGVEQRSVVHTVDALRMRLAEMYEEWEEVIVQRFVTGREVNVGIIHDKILPIAEIDFSAMPLEYARIVSYRSKWQSGSSEDLGSVPRCPAELPNE